MNIRLNPHTAAILKKEMATGRFRSPEDVIERALESFHAGSRQTETPRRSAGQVRRFLDALAEGSEKLPNLPTSAFSRESIYHDHP